MSRLEEDRIIEKLTSNSKEGFFVDIGAGDGVTWSNTFPLLEKGWSGIAIECDPVKVPLLRERYKDKGCQVISEKGTPENIRKLISPAPKGFDVLSLDIDGYDYFVMLEVVPIYKPKIIILEINQHIPPPYKFSVLYQPDYRWGVNSFYGQSIAAAHEFLTEWGYQLEEVVFDNAIYVKGKGSPNESMFDKWKKGFLERRDGVDPSETYPNLGQRTCTEILRKNSAWEGLNFIQDFYKNHAGKFALWM